MHKEVPVHHFTILYSLHYTFPCFQLLSEQMAGREPPTGGLARSEYTDFESLCSGDSRRVMDWVRQQDTNTLHRDGYVKDADEELEILQEQDLIQHSGHSEATPTAPPTETQQSSDGYCLESGEPQQTDRNTNGNTFSVSTAPLSFGYSTGTQSQSNPIVRNANPGQLQATYSGIQNLTTGTPQTLGSSVLQQLSVGAGSYHSHVNSPQNQAVNDNMETEDILSALLCQEEFDPPHTSSGIEHSIAPALHTTSPLSEHQQPVTENLSDTRCPSSPLSACSSSQSATPEREDEETDSVFDTSLSPARHSGVGHHHPARIRSSLTSGFLSLSDASLDSSTDHMEMTLMQQKGLSTVTQSTWSPPCQPAGGPVIPSLLSRPPVVRSRLPSPPLKPLPSCYENIDSDTLAHDDVQFEL